MLQDDFMMIEQDKIDEMERNEGYKHMVLNLQDTVEKLNVRLRVLNLNTNIELQLCVSGCHNDN